MDKVVETLRQEAQTLRKRLHAVEGSIRLLTGSSAPGTKTEAKPVKRHLSAASRKKLSEAAKKRWAGHKKASAT
jgi:hypothetical protein